MKYLKCGYYSSYLFRLRPKLEEMYGIDLGPSLKLLSSFAVEIESTQESSFLPLPKDQQQILAVVDNIISRGLPTFPSVDFEARIIEGISDELNISKIIVDDTIIFTDQISDLNLEEEWHKEILRAHYKIEKTVFRKSRIKDLSNKDKGGKFEKDAVRVVYYPFAAARIHKVIIDALWMNYLSLSNNQWDILVIERDFQCTAFALEDLFRIIQNIIVLCNTDISLPTINLTVYKDEENDTSDGETSTLEYKYINRLEQTISDLQFDLVIDASILHTSESAPLSKTVKYGLKPNGVAYTIRSLNEEQGSRKINFADRINYQITTEKQIASLEYFLQFIFRKPKFWPDQIDVLKRSLALKPVIALLPTGGGKSLCYQLSALLQPGITLVVDPIISLMFDQSENLKQTGIDCHASINSSMSFKKRDEANYQFGQGFYQIIFIAPERLQSKHFREQLFLLARTTPIIYAAIDEAHCISEWGHDFRTAYLNIAKTLREFCTKNNESPSLLALTGTASYSVLKDIQRELLIEDHSAIVEPKTFDRPELLFEVCKVPTIRKYQELLRAINDLPNKFGVQSNEFLSTREGNTFCGLIFVPHANGIFGSNISKKLNNDLNTTVKFYSGKISPDEKRIIQEEYKQNKFTILVATKAFGMGVDKPNIRYTIHYGMPQSIEAFYQEAGRAGRNKAKAICQIIFSDDNSENANEMLSNLKGIEEISNIPEPEFMQRGDVHRMLWFHREAFSGANTEKRIIYNILKNYYYKNTSLLKEKERKKIIIPYQDQVKVEKAIYRLSILGLVYDYTIDYLGSFFEVDITNETDDYYISMLEKYLLRYKTNEDVKETLNALPTRKGTNTIEKCLGVLVEFTYQEIEKTRRTAILQMAEVARNSQSDDDIRTAILSYLETSPFTNKLLSIVKNINPDAWWDIFSRVKNNEMAQQLLGNCRRVIESYPDHPGILILMGMSKLVLISYDEHAGASKDIQQGLDILKLQFKFSISQIETVVLKIKSHTERLNVKLPITLCDILLNEYPSREIARALFSYNKDVSLMILIDLLLKKTSSTVNQLNRRNYGR